MSDRDLWTVLGRAKTDLNFSGQLNSDLESAIREEGYDLTPDELRRVNSLILEPPIMPQIPGMPPLTPEDIAFQKQMMRDQMMRVASLWNSVTESLKGALNGAARTYKTVTWMNMIMFASGMGLFIFSAVYGVISKQLVYSAVFGGLGAATFVSLFVLGAIDKTQAALSNLVQVEIAFTNYLEQVTFWERYAQMPEGMPPRPSLANIEKASNNLYQRSQEAIELLEKFVERGHKKEGS